MTEKDNYTPREAAEIAGRYSRIRELVSQGYYVLETGTEEGFKFSPKGKRRLRRILKAVERKLIEEIPENVREPLKGLTRRV